MSANKPQTGWEPVIWALHCPFTKTGFPVTGNFGSSIQPVIVIPAATWQRLCAEIPALASMQFNVGTLGDE